MIGGPRHGEYVETKGDKLFRVFAPIDEPTENAALPTLGGTGYVPQTYILRDIVLEAGDGARYSRDVYVHEDVPNPQVAQAMLLNVLLLEWVQQAEASDEDG